MKFPFRVPSQHIDHDRIDLCFAVESHGLASHGVALRCIEIVPDMVVLQLYRHDPVGEGRQVTYFGPEKIPLVQGDIIIDRTTAAGHGGLHVHGDDVASQDAHIHAAGICGFALGFAGGCKRQDQTEGQQQGNE